MSSKVNRTYTISETTPASPGTVESTLYAVGLDRFAYLMIDAELVGATGGTLDIYLQRKVVEQDGTVHWFDWLHFSQLGAGAAAAKYSVTPTATSGLVTIGAGTSPALAASTMVGGHPGEVLRALYVAGANTTAGAAIKIHVTGIGPLE